MFGLEAAFERGRTVTCATCSSRTRSTATVDRSFASGRIRDRRSASSSTPSKWSAAERVAGPIRTNAAGAIDDAGAGCSSFRHIVELRPDFVKLDIGLVRSIEDDPARQRPEPIGTS